MEIKIFGSGCKKCVGLYEMTGKVLEDLNVSADLQKITDLEKTLESGIISTPAMMIDDKIMFAGRVPTQGELEKMIKES